MQKTDHKAGVGNPGERLRACEGCLGGGRRGGEGEAWCGNGDDTTGLVAQAPGRAWTAAWGTEGWAVAGTGHTRKGKAGEQDAAWREEIQPPPVLPHPQAKEVPGVKVFRSSATVYFANADFYSDALKQRVRWGPQDGCQAPAPREFTNPSLTFASSAVWMSTSSSPRRRNCSRSGSS